MFPAADSNSDGEIAFATPEVHGEVPDSKLPFITKPPAKTNIETLLEYVLLTPVVVLTIHRFFFSYF